MVILYCKKGVASVQICPETISPALLLDCVTFPFPLAPSDKLEQVKWVSVNTENQEVLQISCVKEALLYW